MKALLVASVIGLLAAACTSSESTAPLRVAPGVERSAPEPNAPSVELATGFNNAGFDLWRTQRGDTNLVFSPMSIGHALLMARAAADEATGSAIDQAVGLPAGVSAHQAWNAIDTALARHADDEQEITLTIADRIWPRADVTPEQTWIDLLAAEHGVTVAPLDFAGDPGGSRETINQWVSDQTEELIPQLLPDGFIDQQTVLVLTDAVYFAARWQRVFGKYPAEPGDFTRLDGSTVPVDFMTERELGEYPHGKLDRLSFAEIPYIGRDFSMLLIVPDEGRFIEVRDELDQAMLDAIEDHGSTGPYQLQLPKWSTSTAIDLLPWLQDIGAAPGSYPAISADAFINGAVHGADISVDEEGTVAAAATAVGFEESGPLEPEMTIRADRPFLYLIRDGSTGIVLFAGQVTDPLS